MKKNPSVIGCADATSPFVLRKNREDRDPPHFHEVQMGGETARRVVEGGQRYSAAINATTNSNSISAKTGRN